MTLIERNDGFDYDLRMLCSCGLPSPVSAADYVDGAHGSHMPCVHCGESLHYGPAVAALRDPDDPALDDSALNTLAWYHTSTQPDWPSPNFSADFVAGLDERDVLMPSREAFIAEHTSKALHVGTYEAAIENMLRRMNDELDSHAQFYLYRVKLDLDPRKINPGFRDENHEIASDISTLELEKDELDAVRYLNVHEAIGTLSLAIPPQAIRAVQRIHLPVPDLTMPADANDDLFIRGVVDAARRVSDAASELRVTPGERRRMELGILPDPTGAAKRHHELRHSSYEAVRRLERHLEDQYLPHASAVLRRVFTQAAAHWQEDCIDEYVWRYRALAALVEMPAHVRANVGAAAWRQVAAI
ncbi:hypothetical protein [Microbacterium esteraromaticum]|uniref:hypothetical protein n=1 Tax=Microbacterium esteraromaticum TaxID=57043 RepID=UPI00195D2547|nr:hypothetical protein [Microbacterium esteraromaticum]MBM7466115.1 hypothetical protein [Microbacterium esteraromaticum]